MPEDSGSADKFEQLRRKAEKLLKDHPVKTFHPPPDLLHLIQELQIHQTELEIQNEELRRAQLALSDLHREYEDLYEFAPCGYITLNAKGIITRANLSAVKLLGKNRTALQQYSFLNFITGDGCDLYVTARKKAGQTGERQTVELRLANEMDEAAWVRADIEADRDETDAVVRWRMVLTDISRIKQAECEQKANEDRLEALLQMNRMNDASLKEISDFVLREIVALTKSEYGFLGFVDPDETVMMFHAWSRNAMKECDVADKSLMFPLAKAGLWAEAIRGKKTVIVNDCDAPHPGRKGCPPGHGPIRRLLSVPTLVNDRVAILAAVANKVERYGPSDARQVGLLTDGLRQALMLREARRVMEESEARFRRAVEGSNDAIWEWGAFAEEHFWISDRFYEISGYDPGALELNRAEFKKRLHPDDITRVRQIFDDHVKDDSPFTVECRIKTADGTYKWVRVKGKAWRNEAGDVRGMAGSLRDIDKDKRLEIQIYESRATLQAMIDLNSEAVFLMSLDGVILAANRALASLLDKELTAMIGVPVRDVMPRALAKELREKKDQVLRTCETVYFENQWNDRHFGNYLSPEIGGKSGVSRISVLTVDITDRKLRENRLRQNGERYRTYIEKMQEGFVVMDNRADIVHVNEKIIRMTGYEADELMGKNWCRLFGKERQNFIKNQISKRKQGDSEPYELSFRRKDGKQLNLLISPTPLFGLDGDFQGNFALVTDITSQKKAETSLLQIQKRLESRIESTTDQMSRILKESEESKLAFKVLLKANSEEKKEVEKNVIVNCRNTITPYLDALKNTRLNEHQKKLLGVVENSLNRLATPFVRRLKAEEWDFTPMEIQVANLIRDGRRNKEIAEILNISESTVCFHRSGIREKLGLKHKKVNLTTYLLSIRD